MRSSLTTGYHASDLRSFRELQISRVAKCRDTRGVSSRRASVPVKTTDAVNFDATDAVTFDTTDAIPLETPVRPYKGYSSRQVVTRPIALIAPTPPIAPIFPLTSNLSPLTSNL